MCTIPAFTFLSARGAGSAYMEGSLGSCMQVSQKVSCNGGGSGTPRAPVPGKTAHLGHPAPVGDAVQSPNSRVEAVPTGITVVPPPRPWYQIDSGIRGLAPGSVSTGHDLEPL